MAEFHTDDVDRLERDVVVLQAVPQHHALVRANRFLLTLVLALIAVVFAMGVLLLPKQDFLADISQRQQAVYAIQNPVLSAEINALKGQMFGLVSGSIESKLRSLEDNIRRGSVTDSLDTLQELKNQVKILSAYSQEPQLKAEQTVVDQKVIKELSELKSLVYLTFVSCGLMIAALAGMWLRNRYRLPYQQRYRAFLGSKD